MPTLSGESEGKKTFRFFYKKLSKFIDNNTLQYYNKDEVKERDDTEKEKENEKKYSDNEDERKLQIPSQ